MPLLRNRRLRRNCCRTVRASNAPSADFCPTGKSLLIFRNRVKPLLKKYFVSRSTQISSLIRAVPFQQRGVAHVINVERDAVDAGSACDERADAYGEVVSF